MKSKTKRLCSTENGPKAESLLASLLFFFSLRDPIARMTVQSTAQIFCEYGSPKANRKNGGRGIVRKKERRAHGDREILNRRQRFKVQIYIF